MNRLSEAAKRRYPRKAFRKKLSFMFGGKANMAFGVEIGEGGMSIKTNETLAVDQKLILNFFLSEKDFFSIRATLRNVASLANTTETIYGVSFDDVPIALRRQIRTYVARTI